MADNLIPLNRSSWTPEFCLTKAIEIAREKNWSGCIVVGRGEDGDISEEIIVTDMLTLETTGLLETAKLALFNSAFMDMEEE